MRRISSAAVAGVLSPNAESSEPLHRQVYEKLREQILLGRFPPGQQMPSTRVLASDLRISRNTVLNAFEQLKAEGYLQGASGSGTYVARALPEEVTRARKVRPSTSQPIDSSRRRWSDFGVRVVCRDAGLVRDGLPMRPFQSGIPAIHEFPFDLWTRISNRCWKSRPSGLLGYAGAGGYMPLRKAVADYLTMARAVRCEPEQVIIVSGAQQAMDLTARLLLNPGDTVWIEEPGYIGAQVALEAASARLIPVPVDEEGLSVSQGVAKAAKARLVYTTPSHQFPLGTTMTLARRLELLQWAANSGACILEDDYDSEFRYSSRPLPALQSLDRAESVIYFGTFSKLLFPALRLGYLVIPRDLVDGFLIAKAVTDHHCPTVEQAIVAEFIAEGHFSRHIRRMRALYLERLEILLESIQMELQGAMEVQRPDAGMQLVAFLRPGINDCAVAQAAAAAGVSAMPLSACYLKPTQASGLLLGYAAFDARRIRQGVRKLAQVLGSAGTAGP